ncbi:MAG TPA: hypothetical protein VHO66_04955 [Ruminiclostridium sp.]|nr:hypothetical protein [Ruminiclostridium sp.]
MKRTTILPEKQGGKENCYNFSDSEKRQYILDLDEKIKQAVRKNEIKESKSVETAKHFITTVQF